MQTFTSCRNSVRCKRWIQHQRFFSVTSCLDSKSVFFGCEQGRRWVRRRQEAWANSKWATRMIDAGSSEESRGTCCREEANQIWKLVSPFHFTACSLGRVWELFPQVPVLSRWYSMFDNFSPGDGCAFGCTPLYGLLQFELSHDVVIVVPKRGRHAHTVYWKPLLQLYTHNWWAFTA